MPEATALQSLISLFTTELKNKEEHFSETDS